MTPLPVPLSVFAVSDHVVVETRAVGSEDKAIRFTLNGPRSYLLCEKSNMSVAGTNIEVVVKDDLTLEQLATEVHSLAGGAEFPIVLSVRGKKQTFPMGLRHGPFSKRSLPTGETLSVHLEPFKAQGMFGAVYFYQLEQADGVSWITDYYLSDQFVQKSPGWRRPSALPRKEFYHGVLINEQSAYGAGKCFGWQIDARNRWKNLKVSREYPGGTGVERVINTVVDAAVKKHLGDKRFSDDDERWLYSCRLASIYGVADWSRTKIFKGHVGMKAQYFTPLELRGLTEYCVVVDVRELCPYPRSTHRTGFPDYGLALSATALIRGGCYTFTLDDTFRTPECAFSALMQLALRDIRFAGSSAVLFFGPSERSLWMQGEAVCDIVALDPNIVGFECELGHGARCRRVFLNQMNPLAEWVIRLGKMKGDHAKEHVAAALERVRSAFTYFGLNSKELSEHLTIWRGEGIPRRFIAPQVDSRWGRITEIAERTGMKGQHGDVC
jgi:hypothetical protein